MEKRAIQILADFVKEISLRRLLLALLTIAALSGAVFVTHSSPAAAYWWCERDCER